MKRLRAFPTIGGTYVHNKHFYKVTLMSYDGMTAVVKHEDDSIKTLKAIYFNQIFTLLPQKDVDVDKVVDERKRRKQRQGEVGIGEVLFNRFISLLEEIAPVNLDMNFNKERTEAVIKYNGYQVFNCKVTRRRFIVRCHPNSLSPNSMKHVEYQYGKEQGWVLSSRFVFTEMDEIPLMQSILVDGLHYRRETI